MIKEASERVLTQRQFAFDAFQFPACSACNTSYAKLEANSKRIVLKILDDKDIAVEDVNTLLDWFDKVRVGLWLGYRMLDGNLARIKPGFHINTRVGRQDRVLFVSKSNANIPRLNFCGPDTLVFAFVPSAFTLIINNYFFTNLSFPFLISRRIGFPFPSTEEASPDAPADNKILIDLQPGMERVLKPLIRHSHSEVGVHIYQPVFAGPLSETLDEEKHLFQTEYVRAHSLDHSLGLGNFFIPRGHHLHEYGKGQNVSLKPTAIYEEEYLFLKSGVTCLEWQNYLLTLGPNLDALSREERTLRRKTFASAKFMNDFLIKTHDKKLRGISSAVIRT